MSIIAPYTSIQLKRELCEFQCYESATGFNADPDPSFYANADPDPGHRRPKVVKFYSFSPSKRTSSTSKHPDSCGSESITDPQHFLIGLVSCSDITFVKQST
jgi:hypothetical protein